MNVRFFGLFFLAIVSLCTSLYSNERSMINIGTHWKFKKTLEESSAVNLVDNSWDLVNIPHTWNALDGQDGGNNYSRTVGWYRKNITWRPEFEGKRIFIEVLAASLMSDTYINGKYLGQHKGGYNAFRYDITNFLNKQSNNVLAIKVDNRFKDDIAPLSGDFTFFGGMYRGVNLIIVDKVHVDLTNNGSNGLFLTTSNVTKKSAKLNIKSVIKNTSNTTRQITVKAFFKTPESFNGISNITQPLFDTLSMVSGEIHQTIDVRNISLAPNSNYEFNRDIIVNNPRLWDGLNDPFRYQVDIVVEENNTLIDKVTDYVGFRFFHVDATGFYLNGNLYPLRGVNRHQDWQNLGYAVSRKEENIDFSLIYKIGANACRLAHYPQSPYFHELFDKYGIVVWVEIPFVDKVGNDSSAFMTTTRQQLREMILQRYNRPSILMWGLQNEVNPNRYDALMTSIMPGLNKYAKFLDSTRLTVQAQFLKWTHQWTSDIYANNIYQGWYGSGRLSTVLNSYKNANYNGKHVSMGISEYGAGGNAFQHEILKLTGTTKPAAPYGHQQPWHPEEYQTKVHELAIKDINPRTYIWGTFLWAMFDFASDSRNEGSTPGINDKGIVSHDRKVLKDSYYLYQANWSKTPVMHIGSRRFKERTVSANPLVVYTNSKNVELLVNGVSLGVKSLTADSACVLNWGNVVLPNVGDGDKGKNFIVAKCIDRNIADTVVWFRRLTSLVALKSNVYAIDNSSRLISLSNAVSISDIFQNITEVSDGNFNVYENDGITLVSDGFVKPGMKLKVTASDLSTNVYYDIVYLHLAHKKSIKSSADENQTNLASNAVDGDGLTRWAANNNATFDKPHWLELDLGNEYLINNIDIYWFNNPSNERAYKYQVFTKGTDDAAYELIDDKLNNTNTGLISKRVNHALGRFIKIIIVGSTNTSQWAFPSINELIVNGWAIRSTSYSIDYDKKSIVVPPFEGLLQQSEFLSKIVFEGNLSYRIEAGAYHILTGDKLVITNSSGQQIEFTITIGDVSSVNKNKLDSFLSVSSINDYLLISKKGYESGKLMVYNSIGKLLYNRRYVKPVKLKVVKGTYFIHYLYDNKVETTKYIVK